MLGQFGPLLPFIEAIRGGGHDVLVVTPEPARAPAEATGVRVFVGGAHDRAELDQLWRRFRAAEPGEAFVIANRETFGRLNTEAMLPSVVRAVAEHRPELVARVNGVRGADHVASGLDPPRAVSHSLVVAEHGSLAVAAPVPQTARAFARRAASCHVPS